MTTLSSPTGFPARPKRPHHHHFLPTAAAAAAAAAAVVAEVASSASKRAGVAADPARRNPLERFDRGACASRWDDRHCSRSRLAEHCAARSPPLFLPPRYHPPLCSDGGRVALVVALPLDEEDGLDLPSPPTFATSACRPDDRAGLTALV